MESNERDILINRMAENLPVLRKKLKMSQEDLGDLVGTSRFTVMQIETQKRRMTWNTFLSLVLLFDKNEQTSDLLKIFGIYTDEFENMLKNPNENKKGMSL